MAFFRKAANILGRTVSNQISQEISSSKSSLFQAIRCMSTSKVFVGGISYDTTDTSLREAFSKYGEVAEARVIVDRDSGRSRGFAFVTFTSTEEASAAIQALDQQELDGRTVKVNYANERPTGYGGGGGFGGGGGYGGGGGSYGGGGGGYGGGGRGGYGGGGYGGGGRGYSGGDSFGSGSGAGNEANHASGGDGFGQDDNADSYADRRG